MNTSLISHIKELRSRIFYCLISVLLLGIVAYVNFDTFFYIFSKPFSDIKSDFSQHFYLKYILEGVLIKLKFSLLFGIILSIPVLIYHVLRFLLPGLHKREKRIICLSIFFSFILSVVSFLYGYFVLLPLSINFLMSHHFIPDEVGILLTYSDNIFFSFNIMAYIIIMFQFPILIFVLIYCQFISRQTCLKASRYVVIGLLVLSAIITPPDILSQCLVTLPLIGLFFLVLLWCYIFKVGRHV